MTGRRPAKIDWKSASRHMGRISAAPPRPALMRSRDDPSVVPSGAGAGHRITDPEKMGRFSEASQD
jgi:hypothetical protein